MKLKPWNLNQVDINDKEVFIECLKYITNEGRKLTPFESAKLELFLDKLTND